MTLKNIKMQGTNISNIDYNNEENAKIIEEALKETEVLDIENEQEPEPIMPQQQQPLQQPFQKPPPQYNPNQPSPFEQQFQQQPQQYLIPQPQQYPIPQPQIEEKKDIFSSSVFNNLKHTLILLILLFLLNNQVFKNIINQLPFTMDEDGDPNIFLTMILCIIIAFSYCIYLQIFN
jgi:hypothetical protein